MTLRWTRTPLHSRLVTLGLFGMTFAVLTGRPAFAVLAAAPLWLAVSAPRSSLARVEATITVDQTRCFESDTIVVTSLVTADTRTTMHAVLRTGSGVTIVDSAVRDAAGVDTAEFTWTVRAEHWGRWSVGPVVVTSYADGLLTSTDVQSPSLPLTVMPAVEDVRHQVLPRTMPNRLGEHVSRVVGDGIEFAGIRPLQSGDSLRRLNWRASARYSRPFVTQLNADRSTELVVVVDGFSDVGPRGSSTLDVSLRGAASIADAYLSTHDRVGLIALGGVLRWVSADAGGTQYYRVVESLLDVRDTVSVVRPTLDRLPRAVLPTGALAVLFSPLLDERAVELARDLRERRYPLVIVDVLDEEPQLDATTAVSDIALRFWRLRRQTTLAGLADLGAHVVDWKRGAALDGVLASVTIRGRIA